MHTERDWQPMHACMLQAVAVAAVGRGTWQGGPPQMKSTSPGKGMHCFLRHGGDRGTHKRTHQFSGRPGIHNQNSTADNARERCAQAQSTQQAAQPSGEGAHSLAQRAHKVPQHALLAPQLLAGDPHVPVHTAPHRHLQPRSIHSSSSSRGGRAVVHQCGNFAARSFYHNSFDHTRACMP